MFKPLLDDGTQLSFHYHFLSVILFSYVFELIILRPIG